MSNYRATVRVEDDVLTIARPLTAPEEVRDLVEWAVDRVVDSAGKLTAVALEFETSDDSDTPVGDGVLATSSTPLGQHADDDEDVAAVPQPAPAGSPA